MEWRTPCHFVNSTGTCCYMRKIDRKFKNVASCTLFTGEIFLKVSQSLRTHKQTCVCSIYFTYLLYTLLAVFTSPILMALLLLAWRNKGRWLQPPYEKATINIFEITAQGPELNLGHRKKGEEGICICIICISICICIRNVKTHI